MQKSSPKQWNIYQIIKSGIDAVEKLRREGYIIKNKIPWKEIQEFVMLNNRENEIQGLEKFYKNPNWMIKGKIKLNSFWEKINKQKIDDFTVKKISELLKRFRLTTSDYKELFIVTEAAKLVKERQKHYTYGNIKITKKKKDKNSIDWKIVNQYIVTQYNSHGGNQYKNLALLIEKDAERKDKSITIRGLFSVFLKTPHMLATDENKKKIEEIYNEMMSMLYNNNNRDDDALSVTSDVSTSTIAKTDRGNSDSENEGEGSDSSVDDAFDVEAFAEDVLGEDDEDDGGEDNNKKLTDDDENNDGASKKIYRKFDVRKRYSENNNDNNNKKRSTEVKNVPDSKKKRLNRKVPIARGTEFDSDDDIQREVNDELTVDNTNKSTTQPDWWDELFGEEKGDLPSDFDIVGSDDDANNDDDDNDDSDRFLNINNKLENLKF